MHHRQHQERRQHDEFALREIDGLRRLPQQRETDRDDGVDRPGRKTCHEKIKQIGHASPASSRVISDLILRDASLRDAPQDEVCSSFEDGRWRTIGRNPAAVQFSFGSTFLMTCLPSTISTRKPWRSMSPFWSKVTSIRMPGSLAALMVRP